MADEPELTRLPDDQLQAQIASNPLVGKPEWNLEGVAPDSDEAKRRIGDFFTTHATARRPWDETAAHFEQRFPGLNPEPLKEDYRRMGHQARLETARQEAAKTTENAGERFNRQGI